MNKEISLMDVVDIDRWQKIQDHFAQVLGITIRTVDKEGNLLVRPSNPARICQEIQNSSAVGKAICEKCLPSFVGLTVGEKWKDGYQCPLGLYNFCIPLDNYAIYILVGPLFLGRRREVWEYRKKAEELGIDLDRLNDCIVEIKLFTFTRTQAVTELIYEIGCHIAQLGYSKSKLEKIISSPEIGKIVHKFYMDRILSALLDVSFNTTNAEFGSIMLLDERTGELYIKIARGLKKEVIKTTRLKIGEGIAGLAIQERNFFLLDDTLTDERIKGRLKRPEIKSAIVAFLQVENRPLGVMNIGTTSATAKITSESVDTLHRLIELTESALTGTLNS